MGTRNVAGPTVRAGDFWGRQLEVQALWTMLEKGSVLLAAPRRYGKSSLMCALADAPRDGWTVIYLDVEYVQTPIEFVTELTAEILHTQALRKLLRETKRLPGSLGRWLIGAIDSISANASDIGDIKLTLRNTLNDSTTWNTLAEELLSHLDSFSQPLLLIIDEFPMMVANFLKLDEPGALTFLKWFRARRQNRTAGRVKYLLGGSLNIEPTLEHLRSEALLNDLQRFRLDPLRNDQACLFVRDVLETEGIRFDTGTPASIVGTAGSGVPFFLQVLIAECITDMRRRGTAILFPADVPAVFQEYVLGPSSRSRFSHYQSRLRERYGDVETPARVILSALTEADTLTMDEISTRLDPLLYPNASAEAIVAMLESDYYVQRVGDVVCFESAFLRAWWRANVPAMRSRR